MLEMARHGESLEQDEPAYDVARYGDRDDDQKLGKKLVMPAWCLFGNGVDT
ncbi:MAG: hypothetical protein OEV01_17135 [Nitrospira sp.]|nr:hypothetical protein [Nitrospira sp.]